MPDFSKIWATNSPLPEFNFTDEEYLTGWDFVAAAPPTKNQFDAWFRATDEKLKYLYDQLQNTASKLYPVGSVYISFNAADPSTLFGGTWVRLKDTFLLANGDTYAANTSGGSATKTISVNNLPSHTHSCSIVGNHTHTRGSFNITGYMGSGCFNGAGVYEGVGGAFVGTSYGKYSVDNTNTYFDTVTHNVVFDASRSWSGSTSSNGSHTHTIGNTGSGLPLNIMPPYKTVYMWRRTA